MIVPNRTITLAELRRNNGERNNAKWIAYQGIVYDVTKCPRWKSEMHERLHFAGQDLTSELPDAPHKADVFSRPCVGIIGNLEQGKTET